MLFCHGPSFHCCFMENAQRRLRFVLMQSKNKCESSKNSSILMALERKPVSWSCYLYLHSVSTQTQAHTVMQARSWWHRAGRKVVIMAPILLSILCPDQSSFCIRVVYFLNVCLFFFNVKNGLCSQKTNTHILFFSLSLQEKMGLCFHKSKRGDFVLWQQLTCGWSFSERWFPHQIYFVWVKKLICIQTISSTYSKSWTQRTGADMGAIQQH